MHGSKSLHPLHEVDAYYRENKEYQLDDHFHNFHELLFVKAGVVEFIINDVAYNVHANDLVIIGSFEQHKIKALEYPYNAYLLSVSSELCLFNIWKPQLLSILLHHSKNNPIVSLNKEAAKRVTNFFDEIVAECRNKQMMWDTRAIMLLMEILLEVYRINIDTFSDKRDDRTINMVLQVQGYIAKNYASTISLDDVANECYISKYHLSRTFKEVTGYGFKEYLILYRLNEAKKLLCATNRTVTDICYDTGHGNVTHFIRLFRLREGVAPMQYRMRYNAITTEHNK